MSFLPVVALGLGAIGTTYAFVNKCILSRRHNPAAALVSKTATACIFCPDTDKGKAVIERQSIGGNRDVRILLDTSPMLPGHMLITTVQSKKKAHELNENEVLSEHEALKQVVGVFKEKYKATSYLQLQKNGRGAGQSVDHYHRHIYPIRSTAMLNRAHFNFFLKFATQYSAKLQGERLTALQGELKEMIRFPERTALAADAPRDALVQVEASDRPIMPGHVIISTTRAVEKDHERTPEEVLACHVALQKVVRIFKEQFQAEEYVQIQESGIDAGQKRLYFQMHLYPVPPTRHELVAQLVAFVRYTFAEKKSIFSCCFRTLKGESLRAAQVPFAEVAS